MADFGIYTKNVNIQALAGVNAGATAKATAATDIYVLSVEALIDLETGFDWSSAWTAGTILDATLKDALILAGAARCAMFVVNADLRAMSKDERETILDFLNMVYADAIRIIKDKDGAAMMKVGEGDGI